VRAQSDGSSDSECAANAASGRTQSRESIDAALTRGTADKSDDLDALMTFGSGASAVGARAGYPQITVPAGYDGSTPRPRNVSFLGRGYSEERLLSLAYSYEQGSKLRRAPSAVNPALYRCAPTKEQGSWPRRSCAPGAELLNTIGSVPALGFSLETATIQDLQSRQSAGSLSAENLTKAYLARIARTNAEGPSLNAVRSVDPDALADARARDAERAQGNTRGPLHGIPLLVSDSFDVEGLPTTAGSLALEGNVAARDSRVVARLRQAGAVILGKTNTGELGGFMSYDIPPGYSALGGQPLNPYDADLTPGGYQDVDHPKAPDLPGASAGAAPAAAAGLAAAVVTKDTSGGVVNPAVANGVVGLRPTFGAVSRTGTLPTARSQDTPAPLAKTVRDATTLLDAIAGPDPQDPDTSEAPQAPNYTAALSTSAPSGKRLGVVESPDPAYNAAVNRLRALGATTVAVDPPSPSSLDHVLDYELKRDLNAYLAAAGGATTSLADIIAYNRAHADEALKYGQSRLEISQGHDLSAGASAYASRRDAGRAESRQRIDAILTRGTSITGDDLDAIVEPGVAGGVTTWSLTGLFPATRVRSAPVAARAGYPQLTVPAGYSEGSGYDSKTRNPVEISLLGPEDGDAVLLAMGHAYERATQLRQAPSATNPSLWRCVPGGAVDAHACAPGDFVSESAPNRVTPDFNGDGHSDAAIGAPDEADGTLAGAGFVNVMYGGAGGLARAGAQQFSQSLAGGLTETGDRFGAATSAADFNGDGFTDLAVGAPDEADVDVPKAGFVNVVYGSSTGLRQSGAQQFSQSQAGGMREAGDRFGAALAAGDVNGDGYADLAVGAPDEADFDIAAAGFVSILYGSPTGLRQSGAQQFSQSQAGGVREEGDRFGAALAVGNFDGDQYADLAVGAPDENDFDVVDAGFVNVLYGGAGGVASSRSAQFSQSQAGGVREAGDRFGSALAVGNFDADEFTDLAVGAPDEDDQTIDAAGFVNVVYGTSGGLGRGRTQQFNQSFAGGLTEAGDRFGSALAAGRFDSDLKSDLAVGAPDEDDGSLKDAGFVNVVYGTGSGLGGSLRRQFNQSQAAGLTEPGDRFGAALTAANYDGDGDWDLLVGAPDENAGVLVRGGLVNMLLGAGDAGLGSSGARQFDQGWGGGNPEAGDRFGAALR
jgi:Asp-tRNA(Asn)/Glu-tRNA(Gln) amidotransferase A subunit family amidase